MADDLGGDLSAPEHLQLRLEDGIVTGRFRSNIEQPDCISVEPEIFEAVADRMGRCKYVGGVLSDYEPLAPPVVVPDNPTNSDWRVGLILWQRFAEAEAKVVAAKDSGSVQGLIAWQRWEYANNVLRSELLQLKDVFGFAAADVDESLWRADRISKAIFPASGRFPQVRHDHDPQHQGRRDRPRHARGNFRSSPRRVRTPADGRSVQARRACADHKPIQHPARGYGRRRRHRHALRSRVQPAHHPDGRERSGNDDPVSGADGEPGAGRGLKRVERPVGQDNRSTRRHPRRVGTNGEQRGFLAFSCFWI
ncbi:hypothetical protein GGR33_005119 [Methylobacterium brachythecii]|uniref:Uncharacterized protein n=1 Tax=Methylobacterium brachythecii TaxID=1176177 RepID=A0A7W6AQI1_9HYPH|nr:hypothetical protein [Methylobacterium brachythecii]